MQSLQKKASEYSGVDPNVAFSIDETNLFQKLGLQTFIDLSTNFYTRRCERADIIYRNKTFDLLLMLGMAATLPRLRHWVYNDEEEWFRSIFSNSKKEDAIQNQYEFFVQRMGGPPLFSQRRGHPALIARHRPFPVTHQAAERWLHHMQQALDTTTNIDSDSKKKMMFFFRHTAFFLVAGEELKSQSQQVQC